MIIIIFLFYWVDAKNSNALANSTVDTNTTKTFSNLYYTDIAYFIEATKNLSKNITMLIENVTPKDNIAKDPLNKFVDANTILTHQKDVYLGLIQEEFEKIDVESRPLDLLNAMENIFLEQLLNDALNKRQRKLFEKKNMRENEALDILKGVAASALKETISNDIPTVRKVENIQNKLTTISESREVRKIISYRVVKDELTLVLERSCETEDTCLNNVLSAIEPYLHEAIHKEDDEVMNSIENNRALDMLVKTLYDPLKIALQQGIHFARRVDTLLTNSDSIIEEVTTAFLQVFRKSISLLQLEHNEPLNSTILDKNTYGLISRRFKFITGAWPNPFIAASTISALSIASNSPEMEWEFTNVHPIHPFQKRIAEKIFSMLKQEYLSFFNLHGNFSMENKINLIEFVKRSLDTKYKDIRQIDFESKDIFKLNHPFLDMSESNGKDIIGARVQSFMNDVDERVCEEYGFPRGAFQLSKTFFGLLESVFPKMNNPFRTIVRTTPEKEEL